MNWYRLNDADAGIPKSSDLFRRDEDVAAEEEGSLQFATGVVRAGDAPKFDSIGTTKSLYDKNLGVTKHEDLRQAIGLKSYQSFTDYYNTNGFVPSGFETSSKLLLAEEKRKNLYLDFEMGKMGYADYLMEAYGRDIMKLKDNIDTTSSLYWYQRKKAGQYDSPLDNPVYLENVLVSAEAMLQEDYWYQWMSTAEVDTAFTTLTQNAALTGERLSADQVSELFPEVFESFDEYFGNKERILRMYKAGSISAGSWNPFIDIDEDGNPDYYFHTDGVLYAVKDSSGVGRNKAEIKWEDDGEGGKRMDRVVVDGLFGTGMGAEIGNALWSGLAGILVGIVDLPILAVGGIAGLTAGKDAFVDTYGWWTGVKNSSTLLGKSRVTDFGEGKWEADNIARGLASTVGFVGGLALTGFVASGLAAAGKSASLAAKASGSVMAKAGAATLRGTATAVSGLSGLRGGNWAAFSLNQARQAAAKGTGSVAANTFLKRSLSAGATLALRDGLNAASALASSSYEYASQGIEVTDGDILAAFGTTFALNTLVSSSLRIVENRGLTHRLAELHMKYFNSAGAAATGMRLTDTAKSLLSPTWSNAFINTGADIIENAITLTTLNHQSQAKDQRSIGDSLKSTILNPNFMFMNIHIGMMDLGVDAVSMMKARQLGVSVNSVKYGGVLADLGDISRLADNTLRILTRTYTELEAKGDDRAQNISDVISKLNTDMARTELTGADGKRFTATKAEVILDTLGNLNKELEGVKLQEIVSMLKESKDTDLGKLINGDAKITKKQAKQFETNYSFIKELAELQAVDGSAKRINEYLGTYFTAFKETYAHTDDAQTKALAGVLDLRGGFTWKQIEESINGMLKHMGSKYTFENIHETVSSMTPFKGSREAYYADQVVKAFTDGEADKLFVTNHYDPNNTGADNAYIERIAKDPAAVEQLVRTGRLSAEAKGDVDSIKASLRGASFISVNKAAWNEVDGIQTNETYKSMSKILDHIAKIEESSPAPILQKLTVGTKDGSETFYLILNHTRDDVGKIVTLNQFAGALHAYYSLAHSSNEKVLAEAMRGLIAMRAENLVKADGTINKGTSIKVEGNKVTFLAEDPINLNERIGLSIKILNELTEQGVIPYRVAADRAEALGIDITKTTDAASAKLREFVELRTSYEKMVTDLVGITKETKQAPTSVKDFSTKMLEKPDALKLLIDEGIISKDINERVQKLLTDPNFTIGQARGLSEVYGTDLRRLSNLLTEASDDDIKEIIAALDSMAEVHRNTLVEIPLLNKSTLALLKTTHPEFVEFVRKNRLGFVDMFNPDKVASEVYGAAQKAFIDLIIPNDQEVERLYRFLTPNTQPKSAEYIRAEVIANFPKLVQMHFNKEYVQQQVSISDEVRNAQERHNNFALTDTVEKSGSSIVRVNLSAVTSKTLDKVFARLYNPDVIEALKKTDKPSEELFKGYSAKALRAEQLKLASYQRNMVEGHIATDGFLTYDVSNPQHREMFVAFMKDIGYSEGEVANMLSNNKESSIPGIYYSPSTYRAVEVAKKGGRDLKNKLASKAAHIFAKGKDASGTIDLQRAVADFFRGFTYVDKDTEISPHSGFLSDVFSLKNTSLTAEEIESYYMSKIKSGKIAGEAVDKLIKVAYQGLGLKGSRDERVHNNLIVIDILQSYQNFNSLATDTSTVRTITVPKDTLPKNRRGLKVLWDIRENKAENTVELTLKSSLADIPTLIASLKGKKDSIDLRHLIPMMPTITETQTRAFGAEVVDNAAANRVIAINPIDYVTTKSSTGITLESLRGLYEKLSQGNLYLGSYTYDPQGTEKNNIYRHIEGEVKALAIDLSSKMVDKFKQGYNLTEDEMKVFGNQAFKASIDFALNKAGVDIRHPSDWDRLDEATKNNVVAELRASISQYTKDKQYAETEAAPGIITSEHFKPDSVAQLRPYNPLDTDKITVETLDKLFGVLTKSTYTLRYMDEPELGLSEKNSHANLLTALRFEDDGSVTIGLERLASLTKDDLSLLRDLMGEDNLKILYDKYNYLDTENIHAPRRERLVYELGNEASFILSDEGLSAAKDTILEFMRTRATENSHKSRIDLSSIKTDSSLLTDWLSNLINQQYLFDVQNPGSLQVHNLLSAEAAAAYFSSIVQLSSTLKGVTGGDVTEATKLATALSTYSTGVDMSHAYTRYVLYDAANKKILPVGQLMDRDRSLNDLYHTLLTEGYLKEGMGKEVYLFELDKNIVNANYGSHGQDIKYVQFTDSNRDRFVQDMFHSIRHQFNKYHSSNTEDINVDTPEGMRQAMAVVLAPAIKLSYLYKGYKNTSLSHIKDVLESQNSGDTWDKIEGTLNRIYNSGLTTVDSLDVSSEARAQFDEALRNTFLGNELIQKEFAGTENKEVRNTLDSILYNITYDGLSPQIKDYINTRYRETLGGLTKAGKEYVRAYIAEDYDKLPTVTARVKNELAELSTDGQEAQQKQILEAIAFGRHHGKDLNALFGERTLGQISEDAVSSTRLFLESESIVTKDGDTIPYAEIFKKDLLFYDIETFYKGDKQVVYEIVLKTLKGSKTDLYSLDAKDFKWQEVGRYLIDHEGLDIKVVDGKATITYNNEDYSHAGSAANIEKYWKSTNKVSLQDVAPKLAKDLDGRIVVGYNSESFDIPQLQTAFGNKELFGTSTSIDVYKEMTDHKLVSSIYNEADSSRRSLDATLKALGIKPTDDAHTGDVDIEHTALVFLKVLQNIIPVKRHVSSFDSDIKRVSQDLGLSKSTAIAEKHLRTTSGDEAFKNLVDNDREFIKAYEKFGGKITAKLLGEMLEARNEIENIKNQSYQTRRTYDLMDDLAGFNQASAKEYVSHLTYQGGTAKVNNVIDTLLSIQGVTSSSTREALDRGVDNIVTLFRNYLKSAGEDRVTDDAIYNLIKDNTEEELLTKLELSIKKGLSFSGKPVSEDSDDKWDVFRGYLKEESTLWDRHKELLKDKNHGHMFEARATAAVKPEAGQTESELEAITKQQVTESAKWGIASAMSPLYQETLKGMDGELQKYFVDELVSFYGQDFSKLGSTALPKEKYARVHLSPAGTRAKALTKDIHKRYAMYDSETIWQMTQALSYGDEVTLLDGSSDTVKAGALYVSKAYFEELFHGASYEDVKQQFNNEDLYLMVRRDPVVNPGGSPSYKIVVVQDKNITLAMEANTFFTYHQGDFDGDKIIVGKPTSESQSFNSKVYNDTWSAWSPLLNIVSKAAEGTKDTFKYVEPKYMHVLNQEIAEAYSKIHKGMNPDETIASLKARMLEHLVSVGQESLIDGYWNQYGIHKITQGRNVSSVGPLYVSYNPLLKSSAVNKAALKEVHVNSTTEMELIRQLDSGTGTATKNIQGIGEKFDTGTDPSSRLYFTLTNLTMDSLARVDAGMKDSTVATELRAIAEEHINNTPLSSSNKKALLTSLAASVTGKDLLDVLRRTELLEKTSPTSSYKKNVNEAIKESLSDKNTSGLRKTLLDELEVLRIWHREVTGIEDTEDLSQRPHHDIIAKEAELLKDIYADSDTKARYTGAYDHYITDIVDSALADKVHDTTINRTRIITPEGTVNDKQNVKILLSNDVPMDTVQYTPKAAADMAQHKYQIIKIPSGGISENFFNRKYNSIVKDGRGIANHDSKIVLPEGSYIRAYLTASGELARTSSAVASVIISTSHKYGDGTNSVSKIAIVGSAAVKGTVGQELKVDKLAPEATSVHKDNVLNNISFVANPGNFTQDKISSLAGDIKITYYDDAFNSLGEAKSSKAKYTVITADVANVEDTAFMDTSVKHRESESIGVISSRLSAGGFLQYGKHFWKMDEKGSISFDSEKSAEIFNLLRNGEAPNQMHNNALRTYRGLIYSIIATNSPSLNKTSEEILQDINTVEFVSTGGTYLINKALATYSDEDRAALTKKIESSPVLRKLFSSELYNKFIRQKATKYKFDKTEPIVSKKNASVFTKAEKLFTGVSQKGGMTDQLAETGAGDNTGYVDTADGYYPMISFVNELLEAGGNKPITEGFAQSAHSSGVLPITNMKAGKSMHNTFAPIVARDSKEVSKSSLSNKVTEKAGAGINLATDTRTQIPKYGAPIEDILGSSATPSPREGHVQGHFYPAYGERYNVEDADGYASSQLKGKGSPGTASNRIKRALYASAAPTKSDIGKLALLKGIRGDALINYSLRRYVADDNRVSYVYVPKTDSVDLDDARESFKESTVSPTYMKNKEARKEALLKDDSIATEKIPMPSKDFVGVEEFIKSLDNANEMSDKTKGYFDRHSQYSKPYIDESDNSESPSDYYRKLSIKGVSGGKKVEYKRDLLSTSRIKNDSEEAIIAHQAVKQVTHDRANYRDSVLGRNYAELKAEITADPTRTDLINKYFHTKGVLRLLDKYDSGEMYSARIEAPEAVQSLYKDLGMSQDKAIEFVARFEKANPSLLRTLSSITESVYENQKTYARLSGQPSEEMFQMFIPREFQSTKGMSQAQALYILRDIFKVKDLSSYTKPEVESRHADYDFFGTMEYIADVTGKLAALTNFSDNLQRGGIMHNVSLLDRVVTTVNNKLETLEALGASSSKADKAAYEFRRNAIKDILGDILLSPIKEGTSLGFKYVGLFNRLTTYINSKDAGGSYEKTLAAMREASPENKAQLEKLASAYDLRNDVCASLAALEKREAPNNADLLSTVYKSIIAETSDDMVLVDRWGRKYPDNPIHYQKLASNTTDDLVWIFNHSVDVNGGYENNIALDAINGNAYLMPKSLANSLEKTVFIKQNSSKVLKLMNTARNWTIKLIMSNPLKAPSRFLNYSGFDTSMSFMTDPMFIKKVPKALNEVGQFFSSSGKAMTDDMREWVLASGLNPFTQRQYYGEQIDTKGFGSKYFDTAAKFFTGQHSLMRYALFLDLKQKIETSGIAKNAHILGSSYYLKDKIDAIDAKRDGNGNIIASKASMQAAYIISNQFGTFGDMPYIASAMSKYGMTFTTFPTALVRFAKNEALSMAAVAKELVGGTFNSSTFKYIGTQAASIGAIYGIAALLISAVLGSSTDMTDEEIEKVIEDGEVIDLFQSLLQGDVVTSKTFANPFKGLKSMFWSPIQDSLESTDDPGLDTIIDGVWKFGTSNVWSHVNPLIKDPIESSGEINKALKLTPYTRTDTSWIENMSRKAIGYMIGTSGSSAFVDSWKSSSYDHDQEFVERLANGFGKAISAEAGNSKAYKSSWRYYKSAFPIVNNYTSLYEKDTSREIELLGKSVEPLSKDGWNSERYGALSTKIAAALKNKESPSAIYEILLEANRNGSTMHEIKTAITNSSLKNKISRIKDKNKFLQTLTDRERTIITNALLYEDVLYPQMDELINSVVEQQNNNYTQNKNYYRPSGNAYYHNPNTYGGNTYIQQPRVNTNVFIPRSNGYYAPRYNTSWNPYPKAHGTTSYGPMSTYNYYRMMLNK